MDKEIFFRGKRRDNGEWVYGYYVKAQCSGKTEHIIIPENCGLYYNAEIDGYDFIDPETVGQFTGLTDRNGTKIFEGDILKAMRSDRERFFHVIYSGTAFYAPEFHWNLIDVDFDYRLEVIGNIFDNPELLEGE